MTAFEALTKTHDYIQKNGEKPSEYNEDKILEAMQIYAEAKAKEATSLDDTKIKYYEDKIEMLIRTSAELEKEAYTEGVKDWEAANEKANKILDGLREKSKYVEAYNQGVMDAAESAEATFDYMEYDEVRFPNEKSIIVNKDSILKLLK